MRTRRHHNNDGRIQIKRGHTEAQMRRLAAKLNIPYGYERSNMKTPLRKIELDQSILSDYVASDISIADFALKHDIPVSKVLYYSIAAAVQTGHIKEDAELVYENGHPVLLKYKAG